MDSHSWKNVNDVSIPVLAFYYKPMYQWAEDGFFLLSGPEKKSVLNLLFSNVCLPFVAADLRGREMSWRVVNIKFLPTSFSVIRVCFQLMRAVFSVTVGSRRSDAVYPPSIG